jgi:hypothetical protein
MSFLSDVLGEFNELFSVDLVGAELPLTLQCRGHVVGPTFHFDTERIDFGVVSYGFECRQTIVLHNTSEISMSWLLTVPADGVFTGKEFTVIPDRGVLQAGDCESVEVVLISKTVKSYDYFLNVDVETVGVGLLTVPITAECQVPEIKLLEREMAFGDCFVRYPYERGLVLVNTSPDLWASYEIQMQLEQTRAVAEFEPFPRTGAIAPDSHHSVQFRVCCNKLGHFRLPVTVLILGSPQPPLSAMIAACGSGPRIVVDPPALSWGPTNCLVDAPRTLTLHNESLIVAPFKVFVKSARSKFRPNIREAQLGPGDSASLTIVANLDDTVTHRDQLHIIVDEGDNLTVALSAKGTGTTMFCEEDISMLDFGPQFTSYGFERRITMQNKGRRGQVLKWYNKTLKEQLMIQAAQWKNYERESAEAARRGGGAAKMQEPTPIAPTFVVQPEEVELRPRTAITFTFRGYSTSKGERTEDLICESRTGKDPKAIPCFKSTLRAEFVTPLLCFSAAEVFFNYTWVPGVDASNQSQDLTMSNKTALPLHFTLRCVAPFSIDDHEHHLESGAEATIRVTFEPAYAGDRLSQVCKSSIIVSYVGHPQRDKVSLVGEIDYPNLRFESSVVDFGTALNDSVKTTSVRVTNCSRVDAQFAWAFVEDADAARAAATTKKTVHPDQPRFRRVANPILPPPWRKRGHRVRVLRPRQPPVRWHHRGRSSGRP